MVYYKFLRDQADWKLIEYGLPQWGDDSLDQLYWLKTMKFWNPTGSTLWFKYEPDEK